MYTIAEYDMDRIGRNGMGSINAKVEGFWSGSTITLYIDRRIASSTAANWNISVSNSSGGRDSAEVEDDMVAYKNYAAALEAMCNLGIVMRMNVDKLEAAYQVQREVYRQERLAKEAADRAAFDADTPMGIVSAAILVEEMALTGAYSHAYKRGEDRPYLVECVRREKTKYYFGGSIMAKKALIAKLAEYSARSGIPKKLEAA